jgi:integrase
MAPRKSRRGTGCVYLRGRIWWIKYFRDGRPFAESSLSTKKDEAERLLKKRQSEILTGQFAGPGPDRVLIAELLADLIVDYRINRRASLKDAERHVRLHLAPVFGRTRAVNLKSQDLNQYIADRRQAGVEDSTINREFSSLRRALNLAAKSEPPKLMRVPRIPRLKENNVREGFLEHEQYLGLRNELPKHVQLIFVMAYHLGMRFGELKKMQWSQVDLRAGEIRLYGRQTKNDEPRTAPIYGEMQQWLDMAKTERDQMWPNCSWVFSHNGKRLGTFYKAWRSACKRASVLGQIFHDLRRTAVRNMTRAGVNRKTAMAISGHKTESIFLRYDIVSRKDLVLAGEQMGRYLEEQAAAVQPKAVKERAARPN